MSESQKTYSRRQLISVAEVANAFALSRDIAGLEAVQQLAECVLQGKLCADLYPPHQYWQHGGQSDLIGKPAQNSVQVWRSLAAKSVERHMSDKDDFNYPPSASTYHLLADDVFAFARTGGLSARAAEAMHELSVRHKAELATPKSSEPQTKFAPSHQAAASVVDESASDVPDTSKGTPPKLTEANRAEILRLYDRGRGTSVNALAKQFHVSRPTIDKVLQHAGIKK